MSKSSKKSMKILIIDTDIGNINSIKNMLERIGHDVKISVSLQDLNLYKIIVLPGVGSFDAAIKRLKDIDFYNNLKNENFLKDKYLIGICLGMQILFSKSEEGKNDGLSLIPGLVKKFDDNIVKVPHMGWNHLKNCDESYKDLDNNRFYFAHSYYSDCEDKYIKAYCNYSILFPAIVQNKNIIGIQFHPEKSNNNGLFLLKQILDKIDLDVK